MKRKTMEAARAAAHLAPRRKSFLKTELRRLITTAHEANLPVSRVDIDRDGSLSLIIGKTAPEKTNDLDQWIDKHATATEGR